MLLCFNDQQHFLGLNLGDVNSNAILKYSDVNSITIKNKRL